MTEPRSGSSGSADSTASRLERALSAWLRWRDAEPPIPPEQLLAEHPELRDLLEPMLEEPAPDPAPEAAPARMLGEFRLLRELGRGGMGVVYEALQVSLNRRVAIKVLPAHLTLHPTAIARFQREAETAARLRHSGIVTVHAVASDGDVHWFAMDLVAGAPLDAILRRLGELPGDWSYAPSANVAAAAVPGPPASRRRGRRVAAVRELPREQRSGATFAAALHAEMQARGCALPPPDATPAPLWSRGYVEVVVTLLLQVADALAHAHRAGVVHRDVKPSNILIRPDGTAVLTDFGLAREQGLPSLTLTGDFAGTPHYIAPEQIEAQPGAVDGQADVFSLGATLYEALTAKRAFDGRTTREVLGRVADADPEDPQRLNPELAPDLAAIAMKALEKERARRYATADALAADLRAFLHYRPVAARRITRRERLRRWARRNPLIAGLSGALALVLLGGVAVALWQNVQLSRSLANYRRMSDVQLAKQYVENRFTVRGYDPSHAAELDAWLDVARALVARRVQHEARLAELRLAALPYTDDDRTRDRREHPSAREHDSLRAELEPLQRELERATDEHERRRLEYTLERTRTRADELARELDDRLTWRFRDPAQQWEHDTLVVLLEQLDDLCKPGGSLPAVERWREHVATVLPRSLEAPRAHWEQVIAEIGDPEVSPQYGGLRIAPQAGLVPLGRDPHSGLQEFAHLLSGEPPRRGPDGALQLDRGTAIVFVLLPGGTARLGARKPAAGEPDGQGHVDARAFDFEGPVHEIVLAPFLIAKHEVTVDQLLRLCGLERGAIWRSRYPQRLDMMLGLLPVETVTPQEIEEALRSCGLALPTEAQWEYAARGGTSTPWYTGAEPALLDGVVNFCGRESLTQMRRRPQDGHPGWQFEDPWQLTAPIGSFPPNPFGLHDMLGNVAEIVRDHPIPYTEAQAPGDGFRAGGITNLQGVRGGSFSSTPAELRCSNRDRTGCETRLTTIGFRPVRTLGV